MALRSSGGGEKKEKTMVKGDHTQHFTVFIFLAFNVQSVTHYYSGETVGPIMQDDCKYTLSLAPLGGQRKTFTEDYERLLTEDDLPPLPRDGEDPDR